MGGNKIIKIWIIIASLFLIIQNGRSQEFGFSALAYPSVGYNLVYEPGMNGGGISIFVNGQKFKKLNFSVSGEYAMTSWGHQSFLGLGINRTWISWERFEMNSYLHLLNGLAFFKPQSIYVFGVDIRFAANFYIYQNLKIFLGVGPRYTLSPGYKKYGLIETSFDIPVELGLKFPIKFVNY